MSLRVTLTIRTAATVAHIQERVKAGEDLPVVLNALLNQAVRDGNIREEQARLRGELAALHAESERLHATIRALGGLHALPPTPAVPLESLSVASLTFAVEDDDAADVMPEVAANPWD